MAKCRAANKVRHRSQGAAITHAAELMAGDPKCSRAINVYRCTECGDWHVGHISHKRTTVDAPSDVERVAPTEDGLRCECACPKLARQVVSTPRGLVAACDRHASRLRTAYGEVK